MKLLKLTRFRVFHQGWLELWLSGIDLEYSIDDSWIPVTVDNFDLNLFNKEGIFFRLERVGYGYSKV